MPPTLAAAGAPVAELGGRPSLVVTAAESVPPPTAPLPADDVTAVPVAPLFACAGLLLVGPLPVAPLFTGAGPLFACAGPLLVGPLPAVPLFADAAPLPAALLLTDAAPLFTGAAPLLVGLLPAAPLFTDDAPSPAVPLPAPPLFTVPHRCSPMPHRCWQDYYRPRRCSPTCAVTGSTAARTAVVHRCRTVVGGPLPAAPLFTDAAPLPAAPSLAPHRYPPRRCSPMRTVAGVPLPHRRCSPMPHHCR